MPHPFRERLQRGPILADGAMGTLLYARGAPYERAFEENNQSNPALVQRLHREYIGVGAELITTNTYGANRFKLAPHGLDSDARLLNRLGARLAREAQEVAGVPVFIAGSIGPLGRPLAPAGRISLEEARAAFREQIEALVEGGVDLLIFETFSDPRELELAVRVGQEVADLPIVAELTFGDDHLTATGATPEQAGVLLAALGVDVIGLNCSIGPQGMGDILEAIAGVAPGPRYSVMPNAGLPGYVNGRFVYGASPAYLASYVPAFLGAGAVIVGGCCGTTPDHIAAMAGALADARPADGRRPLGARERLRPEPETDGAEDERSTLAGKLGRQFVISLELDPPRGLNPEKTLRGAALALEAGADAVNVADSPLARVRMSSLTFSVLAQRHAGIETIMHYTTRDRNLMALQAELLGAHALGLRNVLALTGDPPRLGDYPNATAVYDVDSAGLIKILSNMNEGRDWLGNAIGQRAAFHIGCALNSNADDLAREVERLDRKIEAGAHFVMTQPVFDLPVLEQMLDRIQHVRLPILLGVMPLHGQKHCEFLHNEVPGIRIPDAIRQRMARAGDGGREEGLAIAYEFLREARGLVHGVYIMPSFARFEGPAELIKRLRADEAQTVHA